MVTNSTIRRRAVTRCWLCAATLLLALIMAQAVFSAPDDEEPPPDPVQAQINFAIDESNFDQWIFQGSANAHAGRERIRSRLHLQLEELNRACVLNDAQKEKLNLAAQGDMKRFFDQVEEVRKKFLKVRHDQNAFNEIWQDIQPLQLQLAAGLFGEKSFYRKTLRKTLDPAQDAKYQAMLDERRRFRYRATVDVAVANLENALALRQKQRDAIVGLLVEQTQPPIAFGQYDYYVVMYRLAGVPESELKPLFDARQWGILQQQMNQSRHMKGVFVQNGVLAQDDRNAPSKAATDAAGATPNPSGPAVKKEVRP